MTRRIELTDAGNSFYSAVTRLLSELSREAGELRRKNDTGRLVVSCGVSFASKWLTMRLHRLMATYPDFDVHLEVTDATIDFATGHVDVALRFGNGQYPFATAERIMNESVTPVCSPYYRDKMGGLNSVDQLATCQLIHEIGARRPRRPFSVAMVSSTAAHGHPSWPRLRRIEVRVVSFEDPAPGNLARRSRRPGT